MTAGEHDDERVYVQVLQDFLKASGSGSGEFRWDVVLGEKSGEDAVREAALQLGKLRSLPAIEPLIGCVLELGMDDSQQACENALVAIGTPALEPIKAAILEAATRSSQPSLFARHLQKAQDRIEHDLPSFIMVERDGFDWGIDVVDSDKEAPLPAFERWRNS